MYSGIYIMLGIETVVFVFFLWAFAKYTSSLVKVITVALYVGAAAILATNTEDPIEASRFWPSVILCLLAVLVNGIVGSSNKDVVK